MTELAENLKRLIIDTLKLEDLTPEQIGDDEPLFGEGLGLTSIDALELVVAIESTFDVRITDIEVAKQAFRTVTTLADFIGTQQPE